MNIKNTISKHKEIWQSENFDKWKTTEIMYCKIGWVIDAIDGSEDLETHIEILLNIQAFIEDLQKFEK